MQVKDQEMANEADRLLHQIKDMTDEILRELHHDSYSRQKSLQLMMAMQRAVEKLERPLEYARRDA